MNNQLPKFSHSGLEPRERAEIDNLLANKAMNDDNDAYSELVNMLIRKKYSPSHELAILRKKCANIEQGDAFEEWNSYAEECKKQAKEILDERNKELDG